MNSLIRIGILWCLAISTGRAQEAAKFQEASQAPTLETEEPSPLPASEVRPVNGQPSPFQPEKSEPPRRVTESKRIVIQPGVDAQESEVAMQFMADLEKAGIAKVSEIEMTPTSESPIVTQVFMREDESFEKIKLFLVDLRASGVEKLVLELGGIHPEGYADKQHNGLVFRATKGYSQGELQRLEKVVQAASERCGVSLYLAGTYVGPSEPAASGPPDKKPSVLDAEGYAPGPGSPQPVTKTVVPSSKAIALVIDGDAQESEVVKEVIAALEKAGIATGQSAETATPTNPPISVTLNMRKDESYDKIKQLMEALKDAGVQQMSLRLGGVQYQGKEINQLKVNLQPGYSPAEYEKINRATIAVMEQCGLSLLRSRNWLPGEADVKHPLDDVNLPVSDSSERTNPAMDSGFIPKSSQTADLRTQYAAANKQAHDLAESLRQTPDAAKKAELRKVVQRAFTLRQSLLRAELQEMQARLEKTQQSLDMRDRMADQIVDRRVEDLLKPQLKWDDDKGPINTPESTPSAANGPSKPTTTRSSITELEGDWHLVFSTDNEGNHFAPSPTNLTFKRDQYTLAYQGRRIDRRVEIYPDSKEIRYFKDKSGFVQNHYVLEGDRLTIYDETGRNDYVRGHVALPKTIPKAKEEQKSRWRSGIVEILTQQRKDPAAKTQLVGYGVIVSPQMRIVSQVRLSDGGWAFFAQFDDGGIVPINVLEEGPQGWVTFEPEQALEANHHFRFSEATVGKGDEVHFWGRAATVSESPTLELFETPVRKLDRKAPALRQTVWELFRHDKLDGSLPVLDSNGDLLAITLAGTNAGTNDLLLAVPVAELKTMFPKSLGLLTKTENPTEPAITH